MNLKKSCQFQNFHRISSNPPINTQQISNSTSVPEHPQPLTLKKNSKWNQPKKERQRRTYQLAVPQKLIVKSSCDCVSQIRRTNPRVSKGSQWHYTTPLGEFEQLARISATVWTPTVLDVISSAKSVKAQSAVLLVESTGSLRTIWLNLMEAWWRSGTRRSSEEGDFWGWLELNF